MAFIAHSLTEWPYVSSCDIFLVFDGLELAYGSFNNEQFTFCK